MQDRVAWWRITIHWTQELLYSGDGDKTAHQVKEFLFLHVCALQLQSCYALPDIKEIVEGEIIFLLTYPAKFAYLRQLLVYPCSIIRKLHIAYALPSEGA